MRRPRAAAAVVLLVAVAAAAALFFHSWRTRGRSQVQRGYELASARGCFNCHGPGGLRGFEDLSGADLGDVPPFARDEVESYAKSESEIREWILDGMPRRLREEAAREPAPARERLVVMPAFRKLLSDREADDLVAYVKAVADYGVPAHGPLAEGLEAGARLGCFTCHGPQGRGTPPNPRSLKGYIPSWHGPDLPEVARNAEEVREWILDGSPRRLREHAVARFFLARQVVQMPAYRGRIDDADLERLVRYVQVLRAESSAARSASLLDFID